MPFEKELLTKLKLALEAEGLKASWTDPLSALMRNTPLPIPRLKNTLFIAITGTHRPDGYL